MSSISRRAAMTVGVTTLLAGGVLGAGSAFAGSVSADDSRATVVQGNLNACPAGQATLVDGGTTSTTQNGITVTVTHTSSAQPNPYPAGGFTTLPAGTDVLTVTLPGGDVLSGHIYVKGAAGYNDYPGSALTSLIPPASNGGQIAGLSHYFICGTLSQPTGTVSVTKHVTGSGTGSSGPFAVTVDCGTGQVSHLSLSDGETKDITGISAGSSCTVTETDASQATSTSYSLDAGTASSTAPTFSVAAGSSHAVAITNDYAPGHLTVTKHVSGTPPGGVTSYPISVNCGGTVSTFSLGDGDSHTVDAPGGTSCTVTETDSHGAVATYTVDAGPASSTAPTVQLSNGQTTNVGITNTFTAPPPLTGSVKVTKDVTGTPPGGLGSFDMTLDCGGAITSLSLGDGDSQTVTGIPAGTTCTLTEPDNKGATSTTFAVDAGSPQQTASFGVTANHETDVVVDNDYQPAPQTATVSVTKHVTGTAPTGLGNFDIDVDCGGTTTVLHLADGVTGTVTGLADGSSCTVTEPDNKGASSTTFTVGAGSAQSTAQFDVTGGQTTDVSVDNDYAPATVTVTKAVTGSNPPAGPFTVDADCGSAGDFSFQLNAPGSHDITGLPAGTVCAVTETDSDGATTTSYTVNGAPAAPPATTPALTAGGSATVAITNDYAASGTPTLTISKSAVPATGSFVHRGDQIDYTLTYANTGTADATDVSVVDTLPTDVTFIPSSATTAAYDSTARTLTWQLGTVTAGTTGTLTYSVTVDQAAVNGERLTNIAVIENPSSTTPSNPTVHIVTVPTGALSITKAVDKTTAKYGNDLTYTLHVAASGNITQHDVTVTDKVPAHTTFVSADCASPCTASGGKNGVATWHVGDLAPGSSADLTMVVHILTPPTRNGALPIEVIRNIAVATSTETPHAPSNRVITHITAVLPLHIKKTHHHHTAVLPLHETQSGQASSLPFTGNPTRQLGMIALALLSAGALLMIGAARRPRGDGFGSDGDAATGPTGPKGPTGPTGPKGPVSPLDRLRNGGRKRG